MSGRTKIEWTGRTWNPLRARLKRDMEIRTAKSLKVIPSGTWGYHCERVSPGCKNCYACTMNGRTLPAWGTGLDYTVPNRELVEIYLDEAELIKPLSWKPGFTFPCSMTDMFADFVPDELALAKDQTFQVLTKRAARLLRWSRRNEWSCDIPGTCITFEREGNLLLDSHYPSREHRIWPLSNVWLGVSVENQQYADERIPLLLQTPAAVRFVSYEPALGLVDFTRIDYRKQLRSTLMDFAKWSAAKAGAPLEDQNREADEAGKQIPDGDLGDSTPTLDVLNGRWFDGWDSGDDGQKLDWIIVGGESGPGARPFDIAWARNTVEQCKAAGVACFVKQLGRDAWESGDGDHSPNAGNRLLLEDKKGGDWSEWPEDLRVREFPKGVTTE